MQELILPIRSGMTEEKAIAAFPDLQFQATDRACRECGYRWYYRNF